jgi:hypothetical protein
MTTETREKAARDILAAQRADRKVQQQMAAVTYAPTPTQAENDQTAHGTHVSPHTYDGSPIDENAHDPTPPPGGGPKPPGTMTVTSIAPTTAQLPNIPSLQVNGAGFTATCKIMFGGVQQTTTFVSATQLTCAVSGWTGPVGLYEVFVRDPTLGDSTVKQFHFTAAPHRRSTKQESEDGRDETE